MNPRSLLKAVLLSTGMLLAATAMAQPPLTDLQNLSSISGHGEPANNHSRFRRHSPPRSSSGTDRRLVRFHPSPAPRRTTAFEDRWKNDSTVQDKSRAETVDYLLVGSPSHARVGTGSQRMAAQSVVLSRSNSELRFLRPHRDRRPLTQPVRAEIVRRIQAIPQIIADAESQS